jgi:hypothetical protein
VGGGLRSVPPPLLPPPPFFPSPFFPSPFFPSPFSPFFLPFLSLLSFLLLSFSTLYYLFLFFLFQQGTPSKDSTPNPCQPPAAEAETAGPAAEEEPLAAAAETARIEALRGKDWRQFHRISVVHIHPCKTSKAFAAILPISHCISRSITTCVIPNSSEWMRLFPNSGPT